MFFHRMNDTRKDMSILKLDIEGLEFRVLPYILRNDMIDDIKQLTLEVHGDNLWDDTKPMLKDMKTLLDVWKIMQSKGFGIVNYSPFTLSNYPLLSDLHNINGNVNKFLAIFWEK